MALCAATVEIAEKQTPSVRRIDAGLRWIVYNGMRHRPELLFKLVM
jgi:hypothetical protein